MRFAAAKTGKLRRTGTHCGVRQRTTARGGHEGAIARSSGAKILALIVARRLSFLPLATSRFDSARDAVFFAGVEDARQKRRRVQRSGPKRLASGSRA